MKNIEQKYKDLLKEHKALQKKYDKMAYVASEAISLADAYAGGDSDNVKALNEEYEKLEG